jgi:hypothetical protein
MQRHIIFLVFLLPTLACSLTNQMTMSTDERFLQGAWMYSADLGDGHSSYLQWTFNAGYFTVEGYPPLYQTGRYRVISSTNDVVVLRLTGQSGDWPTDDTDIEVVLDRANAQLLIGNQGPFTRTSP